VYEVFLEGAAERDLKRLDAKTFYQITENLKRLKENPRPPGCRKITSSKNDWRIRVGSYRIVYEISDKTKTVRIMRIKYRREAYR